MYNRFENGVHPRESIVDVVSTRKDHIVSMVDHAKLLEHVRQGNTVVLVRYTDPC